MQVPFITPITRVIPFPREPLRQRLDDRDAPRHRRLEPERHPRRLRRLRQRLPMPRQHRLVRRDQMPPLRQRRLRGRLGRPVLAAHHLDDEVDVAAPRQRHRVVLPAVAAKVDPAIPAPRPRRDRRDRHRPARPARRWSRHASAASAPRRRRRCRGRRDRYAAVQALRAPSLRRLRGSGGYAGPQQPPPATLDEGTAWTGACFGTSAPLRTDDRPRNPRLFRLSLRACPRSGAPAPALVDYARRSCRTSGAAGCAPC